MVRALGFGVVDGGPRADGVGACTAIKGSLTCVVDCSIHPANLTWNPKDFPIIQTAQHCFGKKAG